MIETSHPPPSHDISVIVVDDAKFTCEIIRRVLQGAGFQDIRTASSGRQALEMMAQRKANILVADWLMPEMDGLALTQQVRQFDEENNHYTYVILLTAKEGSESLKEAFSRGVDDFISKSPDSVQLVARIHAAGRISKLQSDLISANRRLAELNRDLEEHYCFDAATGLGNRLYLERQLDNTLRHIQTRNEAACLALLRIDDIQAIQQEHGEQAAEDIVEAAAIRLQQSVRPLDVVVRMEQAEFGLLMQLVDRTHLSAASFRRIHQALNLRAYKTSAGFLSATAAVCLCHVGPSDEPPKPGELIEFARGYLDEAQQTNRIVTVRLPATTPA